MGIYDRDYYRESTRGWWDRWSDCPATVWIILICCGVFFLQLFTTERRGGLDPLTLWGAFHLPAVRDGEAWRLLTSHFLHDSRGLFHIVLNMYLLYWAGREVEGIYGTREFVGFYLVAALVISLGKVALGLAGVAHEHGISLGASGPVTALFVLFALHYPHRRIALFLIISVPAWLAALITVGLDALGFMGYGSSGIGYTAHLLGAVFSVAYYRFHLRVSGWIPRLTGRRAGRRVAAPRLFVSEPDEGTPASVAAASPPVPAAAEAPSRVDEHLEAKLDQVLEKVARFGRDRLTPDEHDILRRASEIYKRRRGS